MTNDQIKIWQYIQDNHVISIAVNDRVQFWAFNAFYASDMENEALYIFSSEHTTHGQIALSQASIAGTISDQIEDFKNLKGLQFSGSIQKQEGLAIEQAKLVYLKRFPFVANMPEEPIWKISFDHLKLTDNGLGFGTKIEWKRN